MPETYFTKFPIIEYANNQVRNLSRRVVLGNNLRQIPTAFYPYDIENEQRADVVAYGYYDDPDVDWLIYITNGIVDPYYGWYLNDDEFNAFITKKYGGLDVAQQRIAYWTTNWTDIDINVTPGFYNSLPELLRKYYIPVWGPRNVIVAYKRRPEDWIMNVNQILLVPIANTAGFAVGDLVQTIDSVNNIVGTGEVMGVETENLLVGQVRDHWDTTAIKVQKRNEETTQVVINDTITAWQTNITDDEAVFWTPIYYYDMEREINEQRKTIILLDKGYLKDAARGVATLLKE